MNFASKFIDDPAGFILFGKGDIIFQLLNDSVELAK
jgi:hypothetical protein